MVFGKLFTNPKMWMNGDANEIKMSGVYTCKDVQNVPTGDGALFVFKTEDAVKQVFVPVSEEGVVYTRVLGEEWSSVTGTSEETEALIQSAIDKANQAQAKADTVDTRLNNIILESGTSDAEVVAARTDSNGQTFTTLGQRLDTQFNEVNENLNTLYSEAVYNYSGEGKTGLFITAGATGAWGSSSISSNLVFRIPKGTKSIKVDAKTDQTAIIAFLRSYSPVQGEIPDWAVEYPARITIPAGGSVEYDVYDDVVYMYMIVKDTSSNYHTATLTFTYPTDLPLAPLSDTSDRSTEINMLLELFGKCILMKGTYYVSGVVMPDSTALIGTPNSIVRLIDSVTSGSAITMSKNSIVQGVFLEGGLSTVGITEGTRYGIEWTGEETVTGFVDNCIIRGFDGAGILIHDTTQKVYRNLLITNCRIRTNFIGIDIKKNSEFNKVTNCNITANHYGIRNRGGNNNFDNCGIDANVTGIQVDADEGTNGGHGGISNCSINHSDGNNGYGIIIKDTGRMVITGCNLYYSKIRLENTNGNIINSCGFGSSAGWEITGGECNVFSDCMIRSASDTPITITNNTQTKVVNCYTRDGEEVAVE